MSTITKMSNRDLRDQLDEAFYGINSYVFDYDVDKGLVYTRYYDYDEGKYENYSYKYSIKDSKVVVDFATKKSVVQVTTYTEVPDKEDDSVMKAVKSLLSPVLDFLTTAVPQPKVPIIKGFDDVEMKAIEKLYIVPESFDAHNHTISKEDTEIMVKSFNEEVSSGNLKASLFHTHETNTFKVLKAWVNPYECMIGDQHIPEGQPLCEIQFLNKQAYEDRKANTLAGVSIGCKAELEDIEE